VEKYSGFGRDDIKKYGLVCLCEGWRVTRIRFICEGRGFCDYAVLLSCASHAAVCAQSVDAVLQAALAIAARRAFGAPVLTYESASTRAFYHGRTEAVRPATREMAAFAAVACDVAVPAETRCALLRAAAEKHKALIKAASVGQGAERLLLGMKLTALLGGRPLPRLFQVQPTRASSIDCCVRFDLIRVVRPR
jgi:hypothetical protein